MGKNKNSKRPKTAAKPNGESLPSFDESALSALTVKIEQGFGKSKTPGQDAAKGSKGQKPETKAKSHLSNKEHSKKPQSSENARGTKRDAKGNAKVPDTRKQQPINREKGENDSDRIALLQEILALGGTEEDLDLVADAASDDEELESAVADKSLKKELAKFVAGLGIEAQVDEMDTDSEIKSDTADEWEEASGAESDESDHSSLQSKPAAILKTSAPNDTHSKDANRLVCTQCVRTVPTDFS